MTTAQIENIARMAYRIDQACREDLWMGNLVSERDYATQFSSFLRHPFGPFTNAKVVHATTANGKLEQKFGADSIIVFNFGTKVKIGMYEAKWPRFKFSKALSWDNIIKAKKSPNKGKSRFTTQLLRQQSYAKSGIVFWEQFFLAEKPGTVFEKFDKNGSTCVLFDDIIKYYKDTKGKNKNDKSKWTNADLKKIFDNKRNIEEVFTYILTVEKVKTLDVNEYGKININDIEIPILPFDSPKSGDSYQEVRNFIKNNGLKQYISLEI